MFTTVNLSSMVCVWILLFLFVGSQVQPLTPEEEQLGKCMEKIKVETELCKTKAGANHTGCIVKKNPTFVDMLFNCQCYGDYAICSIDVACQKCNKKEKKLLHDKVKREWSTTVATVCTGLKLERDLMTTLCHEEPVTPSGDPGNTDTNVSVDTPTVMITDTNVSVDTPTVMITIGLMVFVMVALFIGILIFVFVYGKLTQSDVQSGAKSPNNSKSGFDVTSGSGAKSSSKADNKSTISSSRTKFGQASLRSDK